MEGQIRLRWTSHQGTILSVFDALLSSESFVDVTLACEGQYLRAHKVILSACSPYFQELLNVDVNKHPIFFLKDVKYTELQALIQYMYRGEVNIHQEDLNSLLAVAQALKIRGLADVERNTNSISSDTIILPDLGNASRQKPTAAPVQSLIPLPTPIPAPAPSTSNTHFTRSFQQPHSYAAPDASSTVTFATVPPPSTSQPQPPAKKTKIDTTNMLSTQNVKVQNQTQPQLGNARIIMQRLPTPTEVDPLGAELVPSSSHYEYTGHSRGQDTDFENQEIEQPELYGVSIGAVKLEDDPGAVDIDLIGEDDGENSMSQSGFSWQMDESDNSGMAGTGEDGAVPSCSGGGNIESGTPGGAERGEVGFIPRNGGGRIPIIFRNERFYRVTSQVGYGRTGVCVRCGRTVSDNMGISNFIRHLKVRIHSDAYELYLQAKSTGGK